MIVLDDLAHRLLVRHPVFLEEVVRFGLSGRVRVDFVEQHLDSEEDLLDGDGGLPGLFLVEDREADGAGGVDVWVEEWRREFALWWFRGVLC